MAYFFSVSRSMSSNILSWVAWMKICGAIPFCAASTKREPERQQLCPSFTPAKL